MIGKWHLGTIQKPSIGFEHWVTFSKGHTTSFYDNRIIDNGREYEIRDQHSVDFFGDKAIEFLEHRYDSKPFYLQLNFNGPYNLPPTCMGADPKNPFYDKFKDRYFKPFPTLKREMSDFYDEADLPGDAPLDKEFRKWLNSAKRAFLHMHNDQATMANLAAQNAMVDHNVGKVMETLA